MRKDQIVESLDLNQKKEWLKRLLSSSQSKKPAEDIAIIGLSGKYPQAGTLEQYWDNLKDGKNCITEIPWSRWSMSEPDISEDSRIYTSHGGFLPNVDHFDAMFFNISPVEAESMDPQERLFLQTVWEVFEDAGYSRTNKYRWGKNVGVFVGVMNNDYEFIGGANWGRNRFSGAHSAYWSHANRVSYFFDLHGPSLTIDTACSSSLTAIHLACESLRREECETAIAGGVNLILHPMHYIRLCQMNMLSREDQCKSFGLGADGFVAGEGVGAVLLKPLHQAVKDKDQIYGVIKGSAVNAGGKTGGYTVPNPNAQAEVILNTLNHSGIDPRTISYFEAHGTGTALGDPIEVQGITKAFSQFTKERQFCALGSSKANIGHLESAAGIAALTKVLLQLKHKKIVPSIHTEMVNPAIDLKVSPLFIPQQLKKWENPILEMNGERERFPLRAAISSFGAGGANAHLIVEEYNEAINTEIEDEVENDHVFILSAKHEEQLTEYVVKMHDELEEFTRGTDGKVVSFQRICYTLQTAREPMEERLAVIAKNINDLKQKLNYFMKNRRHPQIYTANLPEVSQVSASSLNQESFELILNSLRSEAASLLHIRETDLDVNEDLVDSGFEDPVKLEQFKEVLQSRYGLVPDEGLNIERSTITEIAKQLYGNKDFYTKTLTTSGKKADPDAIQFAIQTKDLATLAAYWVNGTKIEWENLYSGEPPLRCSLPTYPFAKDAYWAEGLSTEEIYREKLSPMLQILHPLVHVNVSTMKGIEFESRFSGQEFYLKEHQFQGNPLLPAACYMEMARAAGKEAAQSRIDGIRGIVWMEPYLPMGKQPLTISLGSKEDNITFAMKSGQGKVVHCEGELLVSSNESAISFHHPFKAVNLINGTHLFQPVENGFYDSFNKLGLTYGTNFHVLQGIHLQKNYALVKYRLPETIGNTSKDFQLNPVILDGGIQAASFLLEKQRDLFLPFSIDEIRWNGSIPMEGFIYVEKEGDSQAVHKFTIQISDYEGQLAVDMRGVSLVKMKKENEHVDQRAGFANRDNGNVHYFTKKWVPTKNVLSPVQSTIRTVMIMDHNEAFSNTLQPLCGSVRVICVTPGEHFQRINNKRYIINPYTADHYQLLLSAIREDGELPDSYIHRFSIDHSDDSMLEHQERHELSVYSVFHLTKAIMEQKLRNNIRFIYLYSGSMDETYPYNASVTGFAHSLNREQEYIRFKTLQMKDVSLSDKVVLSWGELHSNESEETEIRYNDGQRWLNTINFATVTSHASDDELKMREDGVYIITGGCGGVGFIFARYLAQQYRPVLVLTGRSAINQNIQTKISELEAYGTKAEYVQTDISNQNDTENLIHQVIEKYGEVNGVFHSAGITHDALFVNKTFEEFRSVLKPKIAGTYNLDQATKHISLDFFVLFSSLAGAIGNAGQSDYSLANAYLDHFAAWREEKRDQKERQGRTISINWPLWREGGMTIDEQTEYALKRHLGMEPLSTESGINAWKDCFLFEQSQTIVIAGDLDKLSEIFKISEPITEKKMLAAKESEKVDISHSYVSETSSDDNKMILGKLEVFIAEKVAKLLKWPVERIKPQNRFEEYGINSVFMVSLIQELEEPFPGLSKTLLFEFNTIQKLAEHLLAKRFTDCLHLFDVARDKFIQQKSVSDNRSESTKDLQSNHVPLVRSEVPGNSDDIAIIGMSGRFPAANSVNEFWERLVNGYDCVTEIPPERWDPNLYFDQDKSKEGHVYSKWGGFIDGVDKFDPLFFNMSPLEAAFTDPQERLFLQTVWHTIEDAGYTRTGLSGKRIGVFVGAMSSQYQLFGAEETLKGRVMATSSSLASIANRVSFFFNFKGPSMALDSMCSSSLTALHLACQSLTSGETGAAIVGGVNLSIHPAKYIQICQSGFASTDGRCRSFGADGDGYVPGEGVGAVMLKSLRQAEEDGDQIYGVIKGSAINHGGRTNGYTVPDPNAQAEVVLETIQKSGINPRSISYIEAHGTGTSLGDPIEISGLTKGFETYTDEKQFCAIGSVKSNIGHLEGAAGIASLIKVLLQMKNKELVPSLHANELNPNVSFEETPFIVQRTSSLWENPTFSVNGKMHTYPRTAGISAFGAGGANAHVIVQEYTRPLQNTDRAPYPITAELFLFSAKKHDRLLEIVQSMRQFVSQEHTLSLPELAYTLQVGREPMGSRLAVIANDKPELLRLLDAFISNSESSIDQKTIFYSDSKDDQLREVISDLIGSEGSERLSGIRDLKRLAYLWTSGIDLNWEQYYEGKRMQRISAPLYPFEEKSCWIPLSDKNKLIIHPEEEKLTEVKYEQGISVNERLFIEKLDPVRMVDVELTRPSESRIEEQLKQMMSKLIQLPEAEIHLDMDIRNLGFDSIIAMKWINRIEEYYNQRIAPEKLFQLGTVRSVAQFLEENSEKIPTDEAQQIEEKESITFAHHPLSEGQKGLWLIHQMAPDSYAYNFPVLLSIEGRLEKATLEASFLQLLERHPILRASYKLVDEEPVQIFYPVKELPLEMEDSGGWTKEQKEAWMRQRISVPFDLTEPPTLHLHLLSDSEDHHTLLVVLHHINFDLTSLVVILRDLQIIYEDLALNEPLRLEPLQYDYSDFVAHQRQWLDSEKGQKSKAYWLSKLGGELPILQLPYDFVRPPVKTYNGSVYKAWLDKDLTEQIKIAADAERKSVFSFLMTAFNVLLARYSQQEDIVVGTPYSGRNRTMFEDMVGYFVNMIAIRSRVKANQRCSELLEQVQSNIYEGLEHAEYPFRSIVNNLGVQQDRSSNPIFNVGFIYQNSLKANALTGLSVLQQSGSNGSNKGDGDVTFGLHSDFDIHQEGELDLILEVIEVDGRFMMLYKYNTDLFKKDTLLRMSDHYLQIVQSMLDTQDKTVGELSLISPLEQNRLLSEWTGFSDSITSDRTIVHCFEEQVRRYSQKVALKFGTQSITYGEWNERSDKLAAILRRKGVFPQQLVGVIMRRSIEMYIGIFAILKAGGAYVPIDREYPSERIKYILDHAEVPVVLINDEFMFDFGNQIEVVDVRKVDNSVIEEPTIIIPKSNDLAYVIYTSGSTGKPKGVMIEHRSVVNLMEGLSQSVGFESDKTILALTSISFDMCIPEILIAPMLGMTMVIADENQQKDPSLLCDLIREHHVDIMQATPSRMYSLLGEIQYVNSLKGLSDLMIGGEAFPRQLLEDLGQLDKTRIHNMYGPTETTVWSTSDELQQNEAITAGRPISNTILYIMDGKGHMVPIGVAGELCIGGYGVARGYFKNPDLTNEKFVPLPIELEDLNMKQCPRMFKTGDMAKWLPDGRIEILGRIDRQVKIRGFRIELGEIEHQLAQHPNVVEVAVVAKEGKYGSQVLYAYYTALEEVEASELRHYLTDKLPEYMIPNRVVKLDLMPLTPNGKVDQKALVDRDEETDDRTTIVLPSTETEEKILSIWKSVLQMDEISVSDNLFEIGGESLVATQIITRLRGTWNLDIPFRAIFDHFTIRSLSSYVDERTGKVTKKLQESTLTELEEDCMETGVI